MSAQNLIFNTGMEGSWELAAPFTNAVRAKARYTVRGVYAMSAIIADGKDPRALYEQYQVPDADYIRDLQADTNILALQADSGEWVHVPQSYVVSYPAASGYSYRPLALVLPLGKLPDDLVLDNLIAEGSALVMKHLGISSQGAVVGTGAAELVDALDHDRYVLQRKNAASTVESPVARLVRIERENAQLRDQNQMLQEALRKRQ